MSKTEETKEIVRDIGVCASCGSALDPDSTITIGKHQFCNQCVSQAKLKNQPEQISSGAAFVLSLFAGLGHLYIGLMQKGLLIMIIFVVSWSFADAINGAPLPALVIFYAAFDALRIAKRINAGEQISDIDLRSYLPSGVKASQGERVSLIWGGVLLAAGLLLLLRNLGIYVIDISTLWPVLLILAGLWLMSGYLKEFWRRPGDKDE